MTEVPAFVDVKVSYYKTNRSGFTSQEPIASRVVDNPLMAIWLTHLGSQILVASRPMKIHSPELLCFVIYILSGKKGSSYN